MYYREHFLFTYELAERLKNRGVTVNCLHPGAVATNMGVNRDTGLGKMITGVLRPFFLTPEQGAQTAIYLSMSEDVATVSGKYFIKKEFVPSSKRSYDMDATKKLWNLSEDMTGFKYEL